MFRHISLLMRCFMCCCHFILPRADSAGRPPLTALAERTVEMLTHSGIRMSLSPGRFSAARAFLYRKNRICRKADAK